MLFRKKSSQLQPMSRRRPTFSDDSRQAPSAFSYRARRSEQQVYTARREPLGEDTAVERAPQRRRPSNAALAIGVLLLLVLVWELALTGPPKVALSSSAAASDYPYNLQDYSAAAANAFSTSPFNHFKPAVNVQRVKNELQKRYPELASVSVSVPLVGNRLLVTVDPGTPALRETTAQGQTVVLDSRGMVMNGSPAPAMLAKLPAVTDQSGLPVTPGHVALPSSTVSFIQTVIAQLKSQHLSITGMSLPARASELDVQLAGAPYQARFNLQADAREQAGALAATKLNLESQHITPTKYIDVRVPGRAYYL
jgi:hypothetical protein